MTLPFLTPSRLKKLRDTAAAVGLVYRTEPLTAIFEAFFFISDAFLQMYRIAVFGQFLDATIVFIQSARAFDLASYLSSPSFSIFLKLFGVWIAIGLFGAIKDYLNSRLEEKFWDEIPTKIIEKLSSLNLEDVESKDFQDLLSKVNNYSINRILDTYWRVRQIAYQLTKILSAAFFIFRINTLLALGAFILVLPEVLYKYWARKEERSFLDGAVDKRKYVDYIYSQTTGLRGFPELKVDGVFKFFLDSRKVVVQELIEGVSAKRFDQHIKGFFFALFDQALFRLLLIVLIAIAVLRKFAAGTFQALFNYMISLYDASLALWDRLSIIGDNANYVGDYYELTNFEGFGDVSTGKLVIKSAVPEIGVADLTFNYPGREEPAVRGLNFTIKPGDKVALVGADGSGETTIIKLLCGLYKISEGDILYDGISIKNLGRGELKDKISILFEDFVKYDMSIRKNILLAADEQEYDKGLYGQVLKVTLLDEWLEDEGMDDTQILGKLFGSGVEISSPHWQRIAVARTLYRNRPVFIMDEPLTLVDDGTRRRILENMTGFVGNRTLIVAMHSMEDVRFFDRVFTVDNGVVGEVSLEV